MEGVDNVKSLYSSCKGKGIVIDWMLDWVIRGKTVDDIIEHCNVQPKPTHEEVRERIERERKDFEDDCLHQIFKNARNGDTTAIAWLSKRGLFTDVKMPEELP